MNFKINMLGSTREKKELWFSWNSLLPKSENFMPITVEPGLCLLKPGQKPRRQVFLCWGSFNTELSSFNGCLMQASVATIQD